MSSLPFSKASTITPSRIINADVQCAGCGITFRKQHEGEKYHNEGCKQKAYNRRKAARKKARAK